MRESKLKPCPFCGNRSVRLTTGIGVTDKQYIVLCDHCSATVGFEDATNKERCTNIWNRRIKNGD